MSLLQGKTVLVTGATKGFGKSIALNAAQEGANVVIVSKAVHINNINKDTIFTLADDIEKMGGSALSIQTDIRYDDQVERAINQTLEHFGALDIIVNAANVHVGSSTVQMDMFNFDLMHQVLPRSLFLFCKYAANHLADSQNPHILTLAPHFKDLYESDYSKTGYALNCLGISAMVKTLSEEFKDSGIAVNALWPKGPIQDFESEYFALQDPDAEPLMVDILAKAALQIFQQPANQFTGRYVYDRDLIEGTSHLSVDDFVPKQLAPLDD